MILSISATGFQSHVDTHLDLCAGLNVITGATDSGKSAILRAIKWVALGEPSGDSFVNKAVGYAEVTIVTDEATITKLRKGTKTSYSISRGLETFVYEKAEVPDEVKQLLGIDKSTFGDFANVLNFAYQLDAPFLLSESPSAGAKVLGKLANAEIVDLAMKEASKSTHALQATQKQYKIEQVEKITALQNYLHLDTVKQLLDECNKTMEAVEVTGNKQTVLSGLAGSYKQNTDKCAEAAVLVQKLDNVKPARITFDNVKNLQLMAAKLIGLNCGHEKFSSLLADLLKSLARLVHIDKATKMLKTLHNSDTREQALRVLLANEEQYEMNAIELNAQLAQLQHINDVKISLEGMQANESRKLHLCDLFKKHREYLVLSNGCNKDISNALIQIQAQDTLNACAKSQETVQRLIDINTSYGNEENFTALLKVKSDRADAEFQTVTDELSEIWKTTDICPMCKRPMKKGDLHGHSK